MSGPASTRDLAALLPAMCVGQWIAVQIGARTEESLADVRFIHAAAVAAWGAENCRVHLAGGQLALMRAQAVR